MKVLLTLILLAAAPMAFAQTGTQPDVPPAFPGGMKALHRIIEKNMKYPGQARKDRVGGKVLVKFVVDTLGKVTNVTIEEGIRDDIDNEAIRLVKLLDGWNPGIQKGKKKKVMFRLPLYFWPDKKFQREYEELHGKS